MGEEDGWGMVVVIYLSRLVFVAAALVGRGGVDFKMVVRMGFLTNLVF